MSVQDTVLLTNPLEDRRVQARPVVYVLSVIEAVSALLLVSLIGIIFAGVVSRYIFSRPLLWIDEVAGLTFLWLGMLGAVVALARNEHMRLTLFFEMLPRHIQPLVHTLSLMVIAVVLAALIKPAVDYAILESVIVSSVLGIPKGWRVAALLAGLILMLALVLVQIVQRSTVRDILVALVIAAVALGILWGLKPVFVGLGKINILIFLVGVLATCLAIGVPIAFCFGAASVGFIIFTSRLPLSVMIGRMDEGMSSVILLSVPVFVFLGCILDATGMGKSIVDFLSSLLGHVKAGMSYVLLGSLYLVSGISGSKVSDMATVAPALFPEMKRRGKKPEEMVALLATGAIMADTVPPSIVLIVLGSVAGQSIAALFTSGFVIALFLLLILAAMARWRSRGEVLSGVRRAPFSLIRGTLLTAAPAFVLPFLIRAAVGEGIATATEVSTVAVLYTFALGIFLYGGVTPKRSYRMLVETAAMSGAILLIMGTALAAAWTLTQTGFATQLAQAMTQLPGGWMTFMAVSVVAFLLLGCLLEGLPALVLLAPLMFPIATKLGINGVHYAMVVVVAMNIGLFLPPLGIGYYIACSIGKVQPDTAMPAFGGYIIALLAGLVIIALVPAISIGYL